MEGGRWRRRGYRGRYSNQRGSPRRTVGLYNEASNEALKDEYQEDYDFEGMNKKFQTLFKENEKKVEIGIKYDKVKSFYDSLSRNTDEKNEAPYDRSQQMQVNAETFNLDYQAYQERQGRYNNRYRSGSRGYRRRGGRGYQRRGEYENPRGVRYYRKNA